MPSLAEPVDDDIVIHHPPVRIPIGALPVRRLPTSPGSSFASTFVIGTAAAPWFAAAWITGPSASGSENGTPSSIRSAPAST